MGRSTPWGVSDSKQEYGPGVAFYGTPSHGGFHVAPTLNAKMPDALRLPSGWYEEDVEYVRVVLAFPDRFPKIDKTDALTTLRSYAPEDFERFTGEVVLPGESYARDAVIFRAENKTRMVSLAAAGSGPGRSMMDAGGDVPEGFVEVFAGRGGRLKSGGFPAETAYYLIPEAEYRTRAEHGFVVDEQRHQRLDVLAETPAGGRS